MVFATVGISGTLGTVLIETGINAEVTQVISKTLQTFKVYVPATNPAKVSVAW